MSSSVPRPMPLQRQSTAPSAMAMPRDLNSFQPLGGISESSQESQGKDKHGERKQRARSGLVARSMPASPTASTYSETSSSLPRISEEGSKESIPSSVLSSGTSRSRTLQGDAGSDRGVMLLSKKSPAVVHRVGGTSSGSLSSVSNAGLAGGSSGKSPKFGSLHKSTPPSFPSTSNSASASASVPVSPMLLTRAQKGTAAAGSGVSAAAKLRHSSRVNSSSRSTSNIMRVPSSPTLCALDELPPVKVEEPSQATGMSLLQGSVAVGGLIGSGSYGAVYTCTATPAASKAIGKDVGALPNLALKIISKARLQKSSAGVSMLQKEIKIMSLLDNPNVVRLHHSWSDAENYYLLMDHAPRGDAFDVVELYTKGTPEPLCARIMSQLLTALAYLHSMGIVHRDVKPENLFIDNSGNVLLGDFGLADVVPTRKDGTREKLTAVCGSETYQAPEMIIDRSYGVEVDLWSAGLTMYTLITGRDPWKKHQKPLTPKQLLKKVSTASYNSLPSHVSKSASDLLRRLLDPNPETRMTSVQALSHPWLGMADFA